MPMNGQTKAFEPHPYSISEIPSFKIDYRGLINTFGVGVLAHKQIAGRLQIPYRYYQRMQAEQPKLLQDNVNAGLQYAPERRMVRALDGNVRAFLSDRYRRLDNLELCMSDHNQFESTPQSVAPARVVGKLAFMIPKNSSTPR